MFSRKALHLVASKCSKQPSNLLTTLKIFIVYILPFSLKSLSFLKVNLKSAVNLNPCRAELSFKKNINYMPGFQLFFEYHAYFLDVRTSNR
jgi:hypothetical protein